MGLNGSLFVNVLYCLEGIRVAAGNMGRLGVKWAVDCWKTVEPR